MIALGIVEPHHGRIWAANVGQRGVAFSFSIPSPSQPDSASVGFKASVA